MWSVPRCYKMDEFRAAVTQSVKRRLGVRCEMDASLEIRQLEQ
jgi:hypothetical protein